jgi:hypothetical protein
MTGATAALRRVESPLVSAVVLGAGALALQVRDPHRHGSWGLCPVRLLTGLDCPGCGTLRAVNDLGHGRLLDALHSNALFVGLLPVLAVGWVLWARRSWRGERLSARTVTALSVALGGLALAFAVFRNTPWGAPFRA